jgi:hypothetical protein
LWKTGQETPPLRKAIADVLLLKRAELGCDFQNRILNLLQEGSNLSLPHFFGTARLDLRGYDSGDASR